MTFRTEQAPYAVWRALAATVLVMVGAVSAHTWAGGGLPGLPGLVVLAGVLLAGGLLCLRGELRPVVVAPVVLAAQAGLHVSFGLAAPAGGPGHAGHGGVVADPAWWSWQMAAAHLVSTLLTVAVWSLCHRAAAVVLGVLAADPPVPAALPRARTVKSTRPSRERTWLAGAPRRGPPASTCCA